MTLRVARYFTSRCSVAAIASLLVVVGLWGCASSTHTAYNDMEGRVPDRFFNTLEKRKVSQEWLIKQLGQPDLVQIGNRDQEILTYLFKQSSYSIEKLAPLFRKGSAKHSPVFMHFVFTNNKLQNYWQDGTASIELNASSNQKKVERDEIAVD